VALTSVLLLRIRHNGRTAFRPFAFDAGSFGATRQENSMRRFLTIAAVAFAATMTALSSHVVCAADTVLAADMEIPKPATPPQDIPVHKGPPNCSRWTDDCVNCSRGANGAAPVCSNVGISCQPKPVRCLD